MNSDLGIVFSELRNSAGMTQKQLAALMSGNQTRISRIEAGDGDIDDNMAYLKAINTPEAEKLCSMMQLEWVNLPQPSFRHPDLDILAVVELGLSRVRNFLCDGQVPAVLSGQAQLLERRLEDAGRYLLSLDHKVVYVGEIGVGKTTAVCRQAGLVVDQETAADLKGMLLDTGGGRTTLCDVRIETGERFALTVEPVSDEEIYRLVSEVCRGIYDKIFGGSNSNVTEFRPAEEVERALRNMTGLPRPSRARKGLPAIPDPAEILAKDCDSLERFTAEFAARLCLWRRLKRTIEFDGIDMKSGRQWLRSTFTAINNGRHEDFSLPNRITVTVPFALVSDDRLSITVIDTRGVDGSAIRPDLITHLKDPRAITLLCSKWGSAPDPSSQSLLTHIKETDADPALLDRLAIVALARLGEALSMRHDSGEGAENIDEGYEIKLGQIEGALQKIGLMEVEAIAFDASTDDPTILTQFVLNRIAVVRKLQADSAAATIAAIDQMINNREQAAALAALNAVSSNLDRFSNRYSDLQNTQRMVYERLLNAITTLHARTVWASMRRAGRFWNFDVFQYLGDGAAAEAKLRAAEVINGLNAIIESDLDNKELESVKGFLEQVKANVPQWEADFVNASRHHASAIYLQPLNSSKELWDKCEYEYGLGSGYREFVSERLHKWFEERSDLRDELERRITQAWKTSFIIPLKQVTGKGVVSK